MVKYTLNNQELEAIVNNTKLPEKLADKLFSKFAEDYSTYVEKNKSEPYGLSKEELEKLNGEFPVLSKSKPYVIKFEFNKDNILAEKAVRRDGEKKIVAPNDQLAKSLMEAEVYALEMNVRLGIFVHNPTIYDGERLVYRWDTDNRK